MSFDASRGFGRYPRSLFIVFKIGIQRGPRRLVIHSVQANLLGGLAFFVLKHSFLASIFIFWASRDFKVKDLLGVGL